MLNARLFYRITRKNLEIYLLKILTLSIALACGIVITMFVLNELGFDRFHDDPDNVVRIIQRNVSEKFDANRLNNRVPPGAYTLIGQKLKGDLLLSRVKMMEQVTIRNGRESFTNESVHVADGALASVFTFNVVSGSTKNFGSANASVLISASRAEKYFGNTDVVGKTISISSWQDSVAFSIVAVYEDFPLNAHDAFEIFIPFEESVITTLQFDTADFWVYGRILSEKSLSEVQTVLSEVSVPEKKFLTYQAQPLRELYFGPRVEGEQARHGDFYSAMVLLCISGLIFFLALTNYINLTTLTLPRRAKELAVKKVFGATQSGLLLTLLRESFVVTTVSLTMALLLLIASAHWTLSLLRVDLISMVVDGDITFLVVVMLLFLLVATAPIAMTLKFTSASAARLFSTDTISFPRFKRNITIFQLGISLSLLVSGFIVNRQIQYSMIKEPGKNHDQVIYFAIPGSVTDEGLYQMKHRWKDHNPHIVNVIALSHLPDNINRKPLDDDFFYLAVDHDFLDFFRYGMKEGRWFKVNDFDSSVVNEKGREVRFRNHVKPIGTIQNFAGLYNQPDKPVRFIMAKREDYNFLCIRILEVNIRGTLAYLERFFAEDGSRIHITFMDKNYQHVMEYENRLGILTGLLTLISGLMACCAIYSLSLSISRDKLRQIAVHKIFGASMVNLVMIFVRDFARQTGFAILIFAPITYILLTEWLRIFVYAADFNIVDVLTAITYCSVIIFVTCSAQAMRLNKSNLVEVLKG